MFLGRSSRERPHAHVHLCFVFPYFCFFFLMMSLNNLVTASVGHSQIRFSEWPIQSYFLVFTCCLFVCLQTLHCWRIIGMSNIDCGPAVVLLEAHQACGHMSREETAAQTALASVAEFWCARSHRDPMKSLCVLNKSLALVQPLWLV